MFYRAGLLPEALASYEQARDWPAAARLCGFKSVMDFVNTPVSQSLVGFDIYDESGEPLASSVADDHDGGPAAEVRGLVAEYQQRYPSLGLLLTGGDAPYLAVASGPLASRIFVVPELVLLGLDKILRYNVDN